MNGFMYQYSLRILYLAFVLVYVCSVNAIDENKPKKKSSCCFPFLSSSKEKKQPSGYKPISSSIKEDQKAAGSKLNVKDKETAKYLNNKYFYPSK